MSVTSEMKVLDSRPEQIVKKLGKKNRLCILSGHSIFDTIRERPCIIMACNARIKHVIPAIMKAVEKMDSVVIFELAKTEGGLDGGYTGMDPFLYFQTVVEYAERLNFSKPFFIHADHITIKKNTAEEIQAAEKLIEAQIQAGYTSFAIDASFNQMPENIEITSKLAKKVLEYNYGLETEVGEITSVGAEARITTVEEAVTFIKGLSRDNIGPDLLGVNNGSKHGNYLEGEKVFIDLNRTREIYEAIKKSGVNIAQHGTTGTPVEVMKKFPDCGIRKANIATEWQNIVHNNLPSDLWQKMQSWSKENKKDIKFTSKAFKNELDNLESKYIQKIEEKVYQEACQIIKLFRAENLASFVISQLTD